MKKGFTALEVLAAIFVFSVGAVGVFALVQTILVSTSLASSKLVAAYLAQEGIEIVRNIRDSNWLDPDLNWNANRLTMIDCGPAVGGCQVDYPSHTLSPYEDQPLKLDKDSGFYNYTSGEETKFKRKIIILETPEKPYLLKVWVKVFWQERGKEYSVTAQENLYNWR